MGVRHRLMSSPIWRCCLECDSSWKPFLSSRFWRKVVFSEIFQVGLFMSVLTMCWIVYAVSKNKQTNKSPLKLYLRKIGKSQGCKSELWHCLPSVKLILAKCMYITLWILLILFFGPHVWSLVQVLWIVSTKIRNKWRVW